MEGTGQVMTGVILRQEETIPGHFLMTLSCTPGISPPPSPGQFVMIRRRGEEHPFLFRPFSIYFTSSAPGEDRVGIFYRVAGRGTEIFSRMKTGEELSLIGPLGRGFTILPGIRTLLLVGGGMGVVPLYSLARALRGRLEKGEVSVTAYFGCRSSDFLPVLEKFEPLCSSLRISTDDGSHGFKGTVIERLECEFHRYDPAGLALYGCGPRPMLNSLAALGRKQGIAGQVSVEERMACGVGACLGCVVSVKTAEGEGTYARVCKEGPVFSFDELQG